ncbi:MAG: ATP-binding cassette domain-containing protein [Candidatus Methanoperedens sp.]|nr:ATP-binding cassette domain-containing protein [Candidatus Methanoperedens sp.]
MEELIEVRDLKKYYPLRRGVIFSNSKGKVRAVDGVSFAIPEGKTLGLVGESGCGKSTLGRTIIRLEETDSGSIIYRDTDITHLKKKELGWFRKEVQMVFQDPRSSLDPRMTVGNSIEEALIVHDMGDEDEREERVKELLVRVGLEPDHMTRYPHELSGGQQQRVGIARALAVNPALIVADEPVSALDVSVQAQILNLLSDLKRDLGLSYLFIAHNLWVIRYISDRVAIMYLGKIVELADKEDIFERPLHPYTEALLSSLPGKRNRIILKGEVPSPFDPPRGCRFHPRCPKRFDRCDKSEPEWREIKRGHFVMCHLYP